VLTHQRRCILYCGSHTGIRDQLAKVAVAGLGDSLAEVFNQVDLTRSERHPSSDPGSTLPPVVTAYSPANPSALLSDLNPVWVAVDLGDAISLRWLSPLLAHAKEKNIPVLAWGTNPMSPAIAEIATCAHIVQWPFGRTFQDDSKFEREEHVEQIFQPYIVTALQPVLVESQKLVAFSSPLVQATTTLLRLSDQKLSPFSRNALHHHCDSCRHKARRIKIDAIELRVGKCKPKSTVYNKMLVQRAVLFRQSRETRLDPLPCHLGYSQGTFRPKV
jgi:hypothetical protein